MSSSPDSTPPKVSTWNKANGGHFVNINRRLRDWSLGLFGQSFSGALAIGNSRKS
jgi:hypothetical protein